jgi:hypothetical protein
MNKRALIYYWNSRKSATGLMFLDYDKYRFFTKDRKLPLLATSRYFEDEVFRRKWQHPETVLADIGLPSGFVFMDIECGKSFFALPAAQIVGKNGRLYALDKEYWTIGQLGKTAVGRGLVNLNLKVGKQNK